MSVVQFVFMSIGVAYVVGFVMAAAMLQLLACVYGQMPWYRLEFALAQAAGWPGLMIGLLTGRLSITMTDEP